MTTTQTIYRSPETNKKVRGHVFTATKTELRKVPAMYDTELTEAAEKIIYLHYFSGSMDWYVAELDQETGEAFGYAKNAQGGSEWGYFNLNELESVRVGWRVIERDCWWTPVEFGKVV